MKKTYLLLLLVSVLYSCNRNDSAIVIKGKLDNPGTSYIFLQELLVSGIGKTDSVKLSESGKFKFKRDIDYPVFYSVRIGMAKPITVLAMPGERIKISGNAKSLFGTYVIEGSEESLKCQVLSRHLYKTQNSLDSLNKVFEYYKSNKNIVNIRNMLSGMYDDFLKKEKAFAINFVDRKPNSFSNILAVYEKIEGDIFLFNDEADFKYYDKVDIALFKAFPKSPYVQTLHANVDEMREQLRIAKVKRMLSDLGAEAQEIALPSPKGDTVRLSSTRGKVVLVDFWASWCNPCREENPNLVDIYKKFKNKGFEIFQVSLDKTKDAWIGAIKDDHLNWIQVSDLLYWQSPVAKKYNVEAIPSNFLLDKDGKIIAKGLKGEQLEMKLSQLLENK